MKTKEFILKSLLNTMRLLFVIIFARSFMSHASPYMTEQSSWLLGTLMGILLLIGTNYISKSLIEWAVGCVSGDDSMKQQKFYKEWAEKLLPTVLFLLSILIIAFVKLELGIRLSWYVNLLIGLPLIYLSMLLAKWLLK